METKPISMKDIFNTGVFIFISIYWCLDAILLFFMKPSIVYFLLEIVATITIGAVLFKAKGEYINKNISIRRGIYISLITMILNFAVTFINDIWL